MKREQGFAGNLFFKRYSQALIHSALVASLNTFSYVSHPSSPLPLVSGHWTSNACLVCQDSSAKSPAPVHCHTVQHGGKSTCSLGCSREAPSPLEMPVWQPGSPFRGSFSGGGNLWLPQKYLITQFSNEGSSHSHSGSDSPEMDGISWYSAFFSYKSLPHIRNSGLLAAAINK